MKSAAQALESQGHGEMKGRVGGIKEGNLFLFFAPGPVRRPMYQKDHRDRDGHFMVEYSVEKT